LYFKKYLEEIFRRNKLNKFFLLFTFLYAQKSFLIYDYERKNIFILIKKTFIVRAIGVLKQDHQIYSVTSIDKI